MQLAMPEVTEVQEPDKNHEIELEEMAERDFELFKKNLDEVLSEQD